MIEVIENLEERLGAPLLRKKLTITKSTREQPFRNVLEIQVEEDPNSVMGLQEDLNLMDLEEDPNSVMDLEEGLVSVVDLQEVNSMMDLQEDLTSVAGLEEEVQIGLTTGKEDKKDSMLFAISAEMTAKYLSNQQVQNQSSVTNVILKAGLQV